MPARGPRARRVGLWLGLAVDKLLVRNNMKSAIRSPNLEIWPFSRFWLIKLPLRPLGRNNVFLQRFQERSSQGFPEPAKIPEALGGLSLPGSPAGPRRSFSGLAVVRPSLKRAAPGPS